MPEPVTGRDWLAFAYQAERLARIADWWRPQPMLTARLRLWATALIRTTPGERYCPRCRAMTLQEADWRCAAEGEDGSCPGERAWAGQECQDCGYVICGCSCSHCGGECYVEGDEPFWDEGETVPCKACGGSGLARKQTVW